MFRFYGLIGLISILLAYLSERTVYQAVVLFFSTGIGFYILLLPAVYSIYHVFNHLFSKIKLGKKGISYKEERIIFHYLGLVGIILILIPLPIILLLNPDSLVRGLLFALPLAGLWFLLEFVEHTQHKRSLLLDILKLKEGRLVSIFITSLVLGLIIEGMNLLIPAWSYKNIPFSHIAIFGIPLIVLLGWMPLIVIFLSFYRVFIKENDHLF